VKYIRRFEDHRADTNLERTVCGTVELKVSAIIHKLEATTKKNLTKKFATLGHYNKKKRFFRYWLLRL
jgi:hypothetical protein